VIPANYDSQFEKPWHKEPSITVLKILGRTLIGPIPFTVPVILQGVWFQFPDSYTQNFGKRTFKQDGGCGCGY
jgi:hypothetical protein